MSCKDSVQTTASSELNSDRAGAVRLAEDVSSASASGSDLGRTYRRPSRKQRLRQKRRMQRGLEDKVSASEDGSKSDSGSSVGATERRYRTRGRRGGRRRRKNRDQEGWSDRPPLYEGEWGYGMAPKLMPLGMPDLDLVQMQMPYWAGQLRESQLRDQTMQMQQRASPLAQAPVSLGERSAPLQMPQAASFPRPPPAPPAPPRPAAPSSPVSRPVDKQPAPDDPANRGPRDAKLELMQSLVGLLPLKDTAEVDRQQLMFTLVSVYDQLQTLKAVLGEHMALTCVAMMMQASGPQGGAPTLGTLGALPTPGAAGAVPPTPATPAMQLALVQALVPPSAAPSQPAPASPARQARRAWEDDRPAAPTASPKLMQPQPKKEAELRPLDERWAAFPQPSPNFGHPDGSPLSRPPTESPGLMDRQQDLLPKDLFQDLDGDEL